MTQPTPNFNFNDLIDSLEKIPINPDKWDMRTKSEIRFWVIQSMKISLVLRDKYQDNNIPQP